MLSKVSSRKWHLLLIWPAVFAVMIYVLSALTHPLMAWTGPQAKVMFPPSGSVSSVQAEAISQVVQAYNLETAKVVKLVPFKNTMLLQVTESENTARRYFDLASQIELIDQDEQQAEWLGRHYLKVDNAVDSIEFVTQFRSDYPSVNRLLPVYKINYATDDNLSIFVHTETQALAGITNDWKNTLRFLFQTFHSFTWLNDFEAIRVLLISTMVGICLVMSITGSVLLLRIRRSQPAKQMTRRWHRRIAWVVIIPFFLFSLSGLYHLLFNSLTASELGLRLTQDIQPKQWPSLIVPNEIKDQDIHQISFVEDKDAELETNRYLYRLSISNPKIKAENTRQKRFSGRPSEKHAVYINGAGEVLKGLDIELAMQSAKSIYPDQVISETKRVTRFGPAYDFRNKRLPVWQVDHENGQRVFIDPVSLILVDQNDLADQAERFSFSFLHKWNMLVPLTGRFYRDVLIVILLGFTGLMVILGLVLYLGKRKKSVASTVAADQDKMDHAAVSG